VCREEDESGGYVMPRASLVQLAQLMPKDLKELRRALGKAGSEVRHWRTCWAAQGQRAVDIYSSNVAWCLGLGVLQTPVDAIALAQWKRSDWKGKLVPLCWHWLPVWRVVPVLSLRHRATVAGVLLAWWLAEGGPGRILAPRSG
jgi:hypothetical protein